jgi:NAD(P)-dependent dehydrogenase (short-subunit alcohol dehydrogenase family)
MTDYRKLFDLAGKTAVVLGAASGIGKSSAEALAALGAGVLCADKSVEGAQATAAAIREDGGVADAAACDAASAADVAALAGIAKQKFPRLDIAVTTPGLNIRKTILDYTEEDRGHQPQHQGHGVVLPGLRPHHGRAEGRQPDRLFLGARRHH